MTYIANFEGNIIDLPDYSFNIADKLERQESVNLGNGKLKDKCKSMYDLITELIGTELIITLLGKFNESDPNRINILYLSIINAYNKPLQDFSESSVDEKINMEQIDKIVNLVTALEKAQNIKVNKWLTLDIKACPTT